MKANQSKLQEFLTKADTQFVIPIYQRNYDWTEIQCKQLLNDIIEVGLSEKLNEHFIGSIVYVLDSDEYNASDLKDLIIIDGQQRLTTLTLIYLAIFHLAKKINKEDLAKRIDMQYLTNSFAEDENKQKLRLTDNNFKTLVFLYENTDTDLGYQNFSNLINNFIYFSDHITQENLKVIQKGLSKLFFVDISLNRQTDHPQRIFESLNSTGLELSQSDLIRNYILMDLGKTNQNHFYNTYWKHIEEKARDESSNTNKVSDFIRDYLTLTSKKITKKKEVYIEFKRKYPKRNQEELETILKELKALGKVYNKLLNPINEKDKHISQHLEYIKRLEIIVAYPFIMKAYLDFTNKIIDKKIFISVLEIIQAYTWRRFIVGGASNVYNKIFMSLYDKIDTNNYVFSLQKALLEKQGKQKFPTDIEIEDAIKIKDMYNIQQKNRMYCLERLENHKNREYVEIQGNKDITIEHIFPQKPSPMWKKSLKNSDFTKFQKQYLHTLANLTLSGHNGNLSNKIFLEKKEMENMGYIDSKLWLNKFLSSIDDWNIESLLKRQKIIIDRFTNIWQYPDIDIDNSYLFEEINIFDAEDPSSKKLEYFTYKNIKYKVKDISRLYNIVFEKLFEENPSIFFSSDLHRKISLSAIEEKASLRNGMKLNSVYCIESNFSNLDKFDKIKYALELFNQEEMLIIRYAK